MKEEWRDIKGYEGLYQVSNLGRVKSLKYNRENRGQILKSANVRGYLQVCLCKEGKKKNYLVHRLVAQTFIENSNNYKEVNHKDENKQNNRAENLEWCTHKYNNSYGTRTQRASEKVKGSKYYGARKVQCITTGKKFNCIKEATEFYHLKICTKDSISACCSGKLKSAGKHPVTGEKLVWKYID